MLLHSSAHIFDAVKIVSDLARCKLRVKSINKRRVKAVRKDFSSNNDAFFDVKLDVHERPGEFVLELVFEGWCFTEPPFPF